MHNGGGAKIDLGDALRTTSEIIDHSDSKGEIRITPPHVYKNTTPAV